MRTSVEAEICSPSLVSPAIKRLPLFGALGFDGDFPAIERFPIFPLSRSFLIFPTRAVGQGSDKVEKVYVFEGSAVKKSENFRLYHFRSADKVYKTRAFCAFFGPCKPVCKCTPRAACGLAFLTRVLVSSYSVKIALHPVCQTTRFQSRMCKCAERTFDSHAARS
jgi:hypothetical protein